MASRSPNLTAARALNRAGKDADPAVRAILTLAVTLAGELDASGQPAYVRVKFAACYANVLHLLSQLVVPREADAWSRFLEQMVLPSPGEAFSEDQFG